jgi:hypothetical protein
MICGSLSELTFAATKLTRAENKKSCHDGNQNEIVAAVRQTGARPVFVESL